jgi:phage tail-like protein
MTDKYNAYRVQSHPAFRFKVSIGEKDQAAFTECDLPPIEWEVEEIKEGGLNSYIHQLPGRRKSGRISLKNGVGKSELLDWYIQTMKEKYQRKKVTITLLDTSYKPQMVWVLDKAYPVKWSGPQLKSDSTSIAIQTLELACSLITVEVK